jgi:hypothetical protein
MTRVGRAGPEDIDARASEQIEVGTPISGGADDILADGIFAVQIEQMVRDIEGIGGINPSQEAHILHVIVFNPYAKPLQFDRVEMTTEGDDGKVHSNTFQNGPPGKPTTMTLLKGEGLRVVATTPIKSVLSPVRFTVEVWHSGQRVPDSQRLSFNMSNAVFERGPNLKRVDDRDGVPVLPPNRDQGEPEPRVLDFIGVRPRDVAARAKVEAEKWRPDASLKRVDAKSWRLYGDDLTRAVTAIEVEEWLFIFSTVDEVRCYSVSTNAIEETYLEGVEGFTSAIPVEKWEIDVAAALKTAGEAGTDLSSGPNLSTMMVKGEPITIWVVPGSPPCLIDATSGAVISTQDVDLK